MKKPIIPFVFAMLFLYALAGGAADHLQPLTAASSAGLPTGTWTLNANGTVGPFVINSVDSITGRVNATAFGQNLVIGIWKPKTQRLIFIAGDSSNPSTLQVFTGILLKRQAGSSTSVMAGTLETFSGGIGTRSVFAWVATLP